MSYAAPVSALIRTYGFRVQKKEKRKKCKRKEKKSGLSASKMHPENCVFLKTVQKLFGADRLRLRSSWRSFTLRPCASSFILFLLFFGPERRSSYGYSVVIIAAQWICPAHCGRTLFLSAPPCYIHPSSYQLSLSSFPRHTPPFSPLPPVAAKPSTNISSNSISDIAVDAAGRPRLFTVQIISNLRVHSDAYLPNWGTQSERDTKKKK